ncbi:hypothetical protein TNCV_1479691 [Trichonephila clavipes]|nr:hypothetical protein TNCV_1479691 [Trichonephila clavipes]
MLNCGRNLIIPRVYQSQIDTQGIFYTPHNHMTHVQCLLTSHSQATRGRLVMDLVIFNRHQDTGTKHDLTSEPYQRESFEPRHIQRASAPLYGGSSVASELDPVNRKCQPRVHDHDH